MLKLSSQELRNLLDYCQIHNMFLHDKTIHHLTDKIEYKERVEGVKIQKVSEERRRSAIKWLLIK